MKMGEIRSAALVGARRSCERSRMRASPLIFVASLLGPACGSPQPGSSPATSTAAMPSGGPTPATAFTTAAVALPGGGPDGILMDYLLYDPRTNSIWAPAGNTGSVDVIDVATGKLSRIEGFATQEIERRGTKRKVGPSAAALGDGHTVYIGNRGDTSVCAVDDTTLVKGTCAKLDAMPDGIAYVAKTREVWVTTPRDQSIRVLDGTTLAQKARLAFEGAPEGFAADNTRGRFYTNLEDKDVTLAIDLASRKTVETWKAGCGEDGPHGVRLADAEGVLLVACSARLESLDVVHGGAQLGSIDTGDGVDDFDYTPADHRVYVGAAKAAKLTVAALDGKGGLSVVTSVPTQDGARNGVVTQDGRVYLSHSKASELIVVTPHTK
jgi:DNA-binding beta-propeller fold protein YncE